MHWPNSVFAETAQAVALTPPAPNATIVLTIGTSAKLAVSHGAAITVSNGAIIRVEDLGREIRIVGKKLGNSLVRVQGPEFEQNPTEYSIQVVSSQQYSVYKQIEFSLAGRRGLFIDFHDGVFSIQGHLLRFSDWPAIAESTKSLPPHSFEFAALIDTSMQLEATRHFQDEMKSAGLPIVEIAFRPRATATIPDDSKGLDSRVKETLGRYGFRVVTSPTAVSLEPMIRVQILVAEIHKDKMSKLGIEWPEAVAGQLLPSPAFSSGESLSLTLHALETSGSGKILASPTLLCRSGNEAKFLAGGEIPIKIINFKTQDVVWKQYGVVLKIAPRAGQSGHMSIGIETEVSTIDGDHAVDGIPRMLTNRIETHFDLEGPRTIALSGLLRHDQNESASGLPGLSRLPILGPLFSSRDYNDHRSELIIFVSPQIDQPKVTHD